MHKSPLEFIAKIDCRFPKTILVVSLLLAVLSVIYAVKNIEFWTARSELLSPKNPFYKIYKEYRSEFGDDEVVIVLESADLRRAKQCANLLGKRLEKEDFIQEVFYRVPPQVFHGNALLYLSVEDLEDLRDKLERHQTFLERVSSSPDLFTLLDAINGEISRALVKVAIVNLLGEEEVERGEIRPSDLKLLSRVIENATLALEGSDRYRSPWKSFFQGGGTLSEDGYIVQEEAGYLLMLAFIKETDAFNTERQALDRIRQHVAQVQEGFPGVEIGITGSPALGSDEMMISLKDMTVATSIAIVAITLLFLVSFRSVWRPVFPVVALLIGLSGSVGFVTGVIGHLTLLSVAFGTILAGLGVDFGIHWIVRYDEDREAGMGVEEAIVQGLVQVGRANFFSAVTTAFAFFSLGLADFRGVAELGIIAGGGILLCLFSMLTVLPALVFLLERWRERRGMATVAKVSQVPYLNTLLEYLFRHPKTILAVAAVLILLTPLFGMRVRYDSNVLNLQARETESVEWERRLIDTGEWSSLFGTDQASTLSELAEKMERYEKLPSVGSVRSILSFVPEEQKAKKERIAQLKPFIEPFDFKREEAFEPDLSEMLALVERIRFKLREEEENPMEEAPDTVAGARKRIDRFLEQLRKEDPQKAEERLRRYQSRLFDDFEDQLQLLKENLHPAGMALEDVPDLIQRRYVGNTGQYLIQIFPEEDIWEPGPREVFVSELRQINPHVAGSALQLYESSRAMRRGYIQGGWYALITVFLILLLDFRRFRWVFLALGSLFVSIGWTLLGMGIFDVRFNLANLIIFPLIFGVGIDYSIHVIHRFLEEGEGAVNLMSKSTGKAILLSAMTTMIGFGSLLVAHHRGIASIGLLLTLGVGSALVASILILPALLQLFNDRQK